MNSYPAATAGPAPRRGAPPPAPVAFSVPARHNPRLQAVLQQLNADDELHQLWQCATVNATRLGLGDRGETHARIVANAALRLLRLLMAAGRLPDLVTDHRLETEAAEVTVVLAAALHDLGLAVQPDPRNAFAAHVVHFKARELLTSVCPPRESALLVPAVLQAVAACHSRPPAPGLEVGVLRLADAFDLGVWRGQSPTTAPLSGVDQVTIERGQQRSVRLLLRLHGAGPAPDLAAFVSQVLDQSGLTAQVEAAWQPSAGGLAQALTAPSSSTDPLTPAEEITHELPSLHSGQGPDRPAGSCAAPGRPAGPRHP